MSDLSLSVGCAVLKRNALLPFLDTLAELQKAQQALSRLPGLAEPTHMDLRSLLEVLFATGGISAVKEFFSAHAYTVSQPCKGTRFEDCVVGIKYIDGLNRLWKPRWAREARGRFYAFDSSAPEGQRVIALKDSLHRGIEVLTHAHAVTETQDLKKDAYDHLADSQQACIAAFLQPHAEGAPMDAFLTGKVDGSLIIVNVYPQGSRAYEIISEIVGTQADDFSRRLLSAQKKQEPLITVATQGTLLIAEHIQDYLVTALQALLGPVPTGTSVSAAWSQQAPLLVQKVQDFLGDAGLQGKRVHLCFEAVCKNRRTLTGLLHSELAVSYDHNVFNLLGAFVEDEDEDEDCCKGSRYIPHFDLPATVFPQPIRRRIRSTREVFDIMADMDRVVLGELSKSDFMIRYGFPEDADIHMEGWVLLTPSSDGSYDYAKIKTNLYYKCHKVHSEHVPELLTLPTCCDATYPILRVLREFHTNAEGRFRDAVTACGDMLVAELALGPASTFYAALPMKAQRRVLEALDAPEDQSKTDTIMRMYLNACGDILMCRLREIVEGIWSKEGGTAPECLHSIAALVRQTMNKHMSWRIPLSAEVVKGAMKKLYSLLVESATPK